MIVVVDNRTTAMTGHQDTPGSGRTLMGESVPPASIEEIARACGIRRVRVVDPFDLAATKAALAEELEAGEPSVIVSRGPCPLAERMRFGASLRIDEGKCTNCRACTKVGCPAVEGAAGKPTIAEALCVGCGLCRQMCKFDAIAPGKE